MWASSLPLAAQDADTLELPSDSLLTLSDSLSIFRLLDSLMSLEDALTSQLAVRMAYNSNVLSAGRTLGIDQFGLAPGLSYYHKSGLFADVSSYWSNDFEPNYYLTVLSAGYMHIVNKTISIMGSYDRYFYHFDGNEYLPYENTLTISPFFDFNYVALRTDYAYYFGNQNAHRIMPSMQLNLAKKKWLGIDKISFTPGVFVMFGNEELTEVEIDFPRTRFEALRNYQKYGTTYRIIVNERNVFGLMNYSFSFPLNITHKNWSFSMSYVYNIPKALAGEVITLSESGFVAAGLTWFIDLKRKSTL